MLERIDFYPFFILAAFLFLGILGKRFSRHYIRPKYLFPLSGMLILKPSLFSEKIVRISLFLALVCFGLAAFNPRIHKRVPKSAHFYAQPKEGLALYLLIDRSGSMTKPLPFYGSEKKKKLDWVKEVSIDFVQKRPGDLIGLIGFARKTDIESPLTLDHEALIERIHSLESVTQKEEEGTGMGYALYKTAHLIQAIKKQIRSLEDPPYEIKGGVMVIFTDGFQSPSSLDPLDSKRRINLEEAASFAGREGIKVYFVAVDPRLTERQYQKEREVLEEAARLTEGKLYFVQRENDLQAIMDDIERLEKGKIEVPPIKILRSTSLAPYFLSVAMFFLVVALFYDLVLIRRVP